ncbi:MAG: hypothetical protein ABWY93_18900 [Mycobacterium sp.]
MPYSTLRDKKTELILKAREGSVFIAPYTADHITALTTGAAADLSALPVGWEDLGWTTTDGMTFGRETETSDINSFGSIEPTRSDITRDQMNMQVSAQETKLLSMSLYTGANLTGHKAAAVTGEFTVEKPAIPGFLYYHVLGLFVDRTGSGDEIYLARYMPRARITEFGEQQYTDGDEAILYPLTFTGYEDASLGYSHRWIWAGPGFLSLLDEMDIDQDI